MFDSPVIILFEFRKQKKSKKWRGSRPCTETITNVGHRDYRVDEWDRWVKSIV
jgi:hypothetical protein